MILSDAQKEFLLAHVDGVHPIIHAETITRKLMIGRGFARYVQSDSSRGTFSRRPKATRLTHYGRHILCAVLARQIEILSYEEQRRADHRYRGIEHEITANRSALPRTTLSRR
jgi:hypothetical protein